MRYSLLHRFQGTLLGAILGERLGAYCQAQHRTRSLPLQGGSGQVWRDTISGRFLRDSAPTPGELLLVAGVGSLSRWGGLHGEAWRQLYAQPELAALLREASDTTILLGLLPVALFFHENPVQQAQKLQQALTLLVPESERATAIGLNAQVMGAAIAHGLQATASPLALIPQLLQALPGWNLPDAANSASLVKQLTEVQQCITQGVGLTTAIAHLHRVTEESQRFPNSTPIALAFYGFLSCPEDCLLALQRSAQFSSLAPEACALTGALLGAYNSDLGFPPLWRGVMQRSQVLPNTHDTLAVLTTKLWAAWSGMYQVNEESAQLSQAAAIAPPRLIRPRS